MCRSDFYESGEFFRVSKDEFARLSNIPAHFECKSELASKNVCQCALGSTDYLCQTSQVQQCYVHILAGL